MRPHSANMYVLSLRSGTGAPLSIYGCLTATPSPAWSSSGYTKIYYRNPASSSYTGGAWTGDWDCYVSRCVPLPCCSVPSWRPLSTRGSATASCTNICSGTTYSRRPPSPTLSSCRTMTRGGGGWSSRTQYVLTIFYRLILMWFEYIIISII